MPSIWWLMDLEPQIQEGDEIILSEMEHHSNIVPWHLPRERHGAVLKWVPVTDEGELDMAAYEARFPTRQQGADLNVCNARARLPPRTHDVAHGHDVPILLDTSGAVLRENDRRWALIFTSSPATRFMARPALVFYMARPTGWPPCARFVAVER